LREAVHTREGFHPKGSLLDRMGAVSRRLQRQVGTAQLEKGPGLLFPVVARRDECPMG
jgi:hypothetical protein